MLRKHASLILLAPGNEGASGGGGAAVADPMLESDPSAISSWMKDLPSLDQPNTGIATKKEPDGATNQNNGGTEGAGVSANAAAAPKPGVGTADANGAAKNADAGNKAPDAGSSNAKSDDAKAKEAALAAAEKEKQDKAAAEKAPEEKWPRSSSDWEKYKRVHAEKEGKLQKEIDTRQEKIVTLEAQIADFQKKTADSSQVAPEVQAKIDALTKDNEEMSRRLQVVDVTQHPKFQAYFSSKITAQKTLAKAILGDEKTAAFEEIISLPDGKYKSEKLEEFVTDLPALQQVRIGSVLNNLESIEAERKEEIEKAGKHKETLTAQQKASKEATSKARDAAITDYVKTIQRDGKDGNPAYQPRKDDENWNTAVNERIATARKILTGDGLKPQDLIKAAFDAASLPATLEAYKQDITEKNGQISKLNEELKGLKEQVSKLTAAQPGLEASNGGGTSGNGSAQPGATNRLQAGATTPDQAMESWTKGLWSSGNE
ncbi:hypothetical protein KGP36_02920 [Patescibacteria group bacterium]|nr:hypothetical protein [Patescibacteria group bacterium]